MRISAKTDYAVRAVVELAASPGNKPMRAETVATTQGIPLNFLENILGELRHAGILRSQRGPDGGFRLARSADEVSIADVMRAVEGPLATVRGGPPEESGPGAAEELPRVWIAVRKSLRSVVEEVTVADVASGRLPGRSPRSARTRRPGLPANRGLWRSGHRMQLGRRTYVDDVASVQLELLGLGTRELGPSDVAPWELQLDADLKAEVNHAAHHRLDRSVAGLERHGHVVRPDQSGRRDGSRGR